ncbi:MAG: hypothetical protein COB50_05075, partial [Thiotrichales bacterium]
NVLTLLYFIAHPNKIKTFYSNLAYFTLFERGLFYKNAVKDEYLDALTNEVHHYLIMKENLKRTNLTVESMSALMLLDKDNILEKKTRTPFYSHMFANKNISGPKIDRKEYERFNKAMARSLCSYQ